MRIPFVTLLLLAPPLLSLPAGGLAAQGLAAPPSVPLLGHLVGRWSMTGTVRGKPAAYRLDADWTLQRRYVELHMVDARRTPPGYEARVLIGADTVPGRVIAHWLDNTGAAFSVPPGTGTARDDTLAIDFPYPDGAFHDRFVFDRRSDAWTFTLDAEVGTGGTSRFAEYRVTPRRPRAGARP
jgi:hypothetical protein